MKRSYWFKTLVIAFILVSFSCTTPTVQEEKEGGWKGCVIGFYPENGNETLSKGEIYEVDDFEEIIGQKVGSVVWFPTWDDEFPMVACQRLHERGIIPHLTWEIFWPSKDPNNTSQTGPEGYSGFNDVLNGKYDAYIERFARDAKAFNHRVLIRFMHEFNGNWYVWSGNKNGGPSGGPERVIEVWKYVVDKFRAIGADNVKWLWVPHGPSTDRSEEAWNNVSNYWPGNDYVDWIGLDAYNFYPQDPWGGKRPLRDFDNCFRALYDSCAKLGEQPMMIAEFGTGEFEHNGFDKAAWITDAFTKIKTEYTRVKIYTWFNINKELDWRVNSSPESLVAFRKAMEDPYYIGSPYSIKSE
jgi:hypothetical protein